MALNSEANPKGTVSHQAEGLMVERPVALARATQDPRRTSGQAESG